MAHKAARKSRQHGEMLTETTLNCRKLLENSLETNRLCWMTEMARLFSIALIAVAALAVDFQNAIEPRLLARSSKLLIIDGQDFYNTSSSRE